MIDFKKITKPYEQEAVQTLSRFVQINSVYDEKTATETNPYGLGVHDALVFVQRLARKDGFNVKYIDGRVTEITFGEGKNEIGIFAHADVVPATGKWNHPPFSGAIVGDYMYSRGTSDDKGPLIAAYFALKALKENDLIKNYRIRMVVGGDEERGSSCMNHYFKKQGNPPVTYGFTPDAEFPLIYGEKGITNYISTKNIDLSPLIYLKGGEASNSVIDKVDFIIEKDDTFIDTLQAMKLEFNIKNVLDQTHVTVYGKSAHGSLPEKGINAGVLALGALAKHYNIGFLSNLVDSYKDLNGRNLDVYSRTDLLGVTTLNIGLIEYNDTTLTFTTNFRYPEDVVLDDAIETIRENTDMDIKIKSTSRVLLFDPKSDFIQKLLSVYQIETGDFEGKPMGIGGGTYAKECPNTVAFGSAFKGRDGSIHEPNEHVLISDIYAQMHIYAHAIHALGTEL